MHIAHTYCAARMMVFCETVANSDYIENKNGRVLNSKIDRFAKIAFFFFK